jgi:ATP-binding cassette, subfamily B, bacterial PglK
MTVWNTLFVILDKTERRRLLLVLAGTFVAGVLEMIGISAIPVFVGIMIDPPSSSPVIPRFNWVHETNKANLLMAGAAMLCGVLLAKTFLLVALVYKETHFLQTIGASISNRLFHGYVQSPYHLHLQRNSADVVRNMTEETSHAMDFLRAGLRLVREGLVLALVFLLMLVVEPVVSLTVFSMFALVSLAFYSSLRRVLTEHGRLWGNHWSRRMQIISQSLGAIKDIKILGRESHLTNLFQTETASLHRQETFREVTGLLPRYFLEVLAMVAVMLIALIFLLSDKPPASLAPVLALYGMAVARLLPALITINSSLLEIRYRWPAFELVSAELKAFPTATLINSCDRPQGRRMMPIAPSITLDNVHYRYAGAIEEALQGVSATIDAGTMVGFVGTSGAGKSTLIDLIVGLHVPDEGRVLVDGVDIHEDLPAWQRRIGYVPQNIYLIDDSIRRNIAFGLPDDEIDDVAVAHAMRAARLESFVQTLPMGIESPVGHEGIRLSGGQRQRIAIARALYHDPSVLIMDEATNALDPETELAIMTELRLLQEEKTVIVVAHRPSTVEGCNQVMRLEAGRIVPEFKMTAAVHSS